MTRLLWPVFPRRQVLDVSLQFSQPCSEMFRVCYFAGDACRIRTVLTDNGWCCQIDTSNPTVTNGRLCQSFSQISLSSTGRLIFAVTAIYSILDAQSYDYAYPSWFAEGFSVSEWQSNVIKAATGTANSRVTQHHKQ